MSRPFSVHPEALTDLDESVVFYFGVDPILATDFVEEYDLNVELILRYPESYPRIEGNYRRKVMGRFPFTIVYFCTQSEVRLLAVAHHSRDPEYWLDRT